MTAPVRGPAWEQMQRDLRDNLGVADNIWSDLLCRYGYAAGRADAQAESAAAAQVVRRSAMRRSLWLAYDLHAERSLAWSTEAAGDSDGDDADRLRARRRMMLHRRAMDRIARLIRGEPAFGPIDMLATAAKVST